MAKYCMKCGAELRPGAKYCLKCGTPVSEYDNEKKSIKQIKKIFENGGIENEIYKYIRIG